MRIMKAALLFAGSGPLVVLTSRASFTEPTLLEKLGAKSFSTFAVTAEQIAVVFPLVNAAAPEIDLARWRSFARPLVDDMAPPSSGAIGSTRAHRDRGGTPSRL